MMNLWEVALLVVAITVMVVNLWNMFLTTKMLKKYEPLLDKTLTVFDKATDWLLKQYEEDDEE